jgi:hypothetical protein
MTIAEPTSQADSAQQLIGHWRLTQWRSTANGDAEVHFPFGENPSGSLVYGADGWVSVQIVAQDRPRFTVDDPHGGPAEEHAAAYLTCLAYCGRWEIREDRVVHRIEISLYPNWEGQEQVRLFELTDRTLVLRTPPITMNGVPFTTELEWTRAGR